MRKHFPVHIIPIFLFTLISCLKTEEPVEKNFVKSIERISEDDFEASLIEKAENYYPPREEVAGAARPWLEVPESGYWYYDSFDGVKIPYCITKEAIEYYSGLIDRFNADKDGTFFLAAEFNYKAEVKFFENYTSPATDSEGIETEQQTFSSVYVVLMQLKWSDYCGSLCAMWIDKKREVVFSAEGDLLAVFLDGTIAVPVS